MTKKDSITNFSRRQYWLISSIYGKERTSFSLFYFLFVYIIEEYFLYPRVMVVSENELIKACQDWKLEHFSYFYEKYSQSVYKFIYLKTFDRELAEDITSDVFMKALSKISTFTPKADATFKSWIFRIAYNTIIDHYRTKKEEPSLDEVAERGYYLDIGDMIDKKQNAKKVLKFLDTLDPLVKKIVIMRFWDELSFKEIAEITWESEDNCKKIVYRNIKKMDISTLILLLLFINFL